MKIHSVRTRLTLWNVGVMALILAGSAVTLHYLVRLNLVSAIDQELDRRFEWESQVNAWPMAHPRPEDLQTVERRDPEETRRTRSAADSPSQNPRRSPSQEEAELREAFLAPAIFDLQGRERNYFSTPHLWNQDAFLRSRIGTPVHMNMSLQGKPVRLLSSPVYWQGKIVGVVQLVRPLDEAEKMMSNLDRTLLMLLVPGLLIAGLSGAFLTDRSLRPVKRFSEAASHLASQELSHRLPVKGNDEFTELAVNFNRMTERLETAFGSLESANDNLESANLSLKAAYERQRRFIADASHELRTPLTAIKANTSMALADPETCDSCRESMEVMDSAATMMSRIVNDLLLLARSDNDELRLNSETIPVSALIESTVSEMNRKRRENPVRTHLPHPDLWITGDEHHLKRLLINLFENALRYTPVEKEITVSVEEAGGVVILKIEDEGTGILPQHLPHLFERFYRTDDARTRESGGAGLGLSICQSIVKAHGGTIEIDSQPGEGTQVTVILPHCCTKGTINREIMESAAAERNPSFSPT